jgi:hypothetical protein
MLLLLFFKKIERKREKEMQLAIHITPSSAFGRLCPTTATETVPQTGMSVALPAAATTRHRRPTPQ